MNTLRIVFSLAMVLGVMYAAIGLFDSLLQMTVGIVLTAVGVIGYGAVQYTEDRRDDMRLYRESVWMRRED